MTIKFFPKMLTDKKELLKDYINFLLVIILSFFFEYDSKELTESIWFYSVVITYLLLLMYFLYYFFSVHEKIIHGILEFLKMILAFIVFAFIFYIQLVFIDAAFGDTSTFEEGFHFNMDKFIYFIPFVIYKYRDYLKPEKLKNSIEDGFIFKTQKVAIFSILFGFFYKFNPRLSFCLVYTIFFFPFTQTIQFIKQKRKSK